MANPPPLPGDANFVALRMTDFPGRFSPMLVKELRQGMRTNLFTIAFILLQTVMILSLLAGLADPGSPASAGFFWFFIVVTLLLVQPLRGFGALSSEFTLNTMDLIQLTRLDAWRITLGKWTALNAQTLLFLTGVLPYLVMRYFLGNVNFVVDLAALVYLGLGSALASAITIGCSAFKHFVLRGLLVLGFGIGFIALYVTMLNLIISPGASGFNSATMGLAALAMLYGCFFFLSFGASRIAPLSENHSTRKRLVALGFVLLSLGFFLLDAAAAAHVVIALILGFASVDALTEPLPVFARVLEPFRKNLILRASAWVLTPGWLSGIVFFLLCVWIWITLAALAPTSGSSSLPSSEPDTMLTSLLSTANVFLFPLIFIHLFFPKHASGSFTFGIYFFIQACLAVLTVMIAVLSDAMSRYDDLIFALVPIPSVLLVALENGGTDRKFELIYFGAAVLTLVLGIAVPFLRQREAVREFVRNLKAP
jgi:hypothetical protein